MYVFSGRGAVFGEVDPDNCFQTKVPDLGSVGIKGYRRALIDMTLCTIDRTTSATVTDKEPATVTERGMLLNNIIWLPKTKNTVVYPQKGAACEAKRQRRV